MCFGLCSVHLLVFKKRIQISKVSDHASSDLKLRILESLYMYKRKPKLNDISSAMPLLVIKWFYLLYWWYAIFLLNIDNFPIEWRHLSANCKGNSSQLRLSDFTGKMSAEEIWKAIQWPSRSLERSFFRWNHFTSKKYEKHQVRLQGRLQVRLQVKFFRFMTSSLISPTALRIIYF